MNKALLKPRQCVIVRVPHNAPCIYLICRANDLGEWNTCDNANTRLVYLDWDYPSLAANLGFKPCSKCRATDGTVDCAHKTASQMIQEAQAFLDTHLEIGFDDPGYFED